MRTHRVAVSRRILAQASTEVGLGFGDDKLILKQLGLAYACGFNI